MDYHPDWGRTLNHNGYVLVFCPDHPNAWKRNFEGHVYGHRLIAEVTLGRLLTPAEHVHHINGNKQDNRPENLRVLSNAEHGRLHRLQDGPARKIRLLCPQCGKSFRRLYGQTSRVPSRKNKRDFCSRQCSGAFSARLRHWRPVKTGGASVTQG